MMKQKKKVLSKTLAFVLTLVMVIGLMPVTSFAEGEGSATPKKLLIEFYKATDPTKPVELVSVEVDTELKKVSMMGFSVDSNTKTYLNFAATALKEADDEAVIKSEEFRKVFDQALLELNESYPDSLNRQLASIGYKADDAPTQVTYEKLDYSKVKKPNKVFDNTTDTTRRVIKVRIKGKLMTVSFDVNMPELDSPSTQFVEYNTRATRPDVPEKEGYTFEG